MASIFISTTLFALFASMLIGLGNGVEKHLQQS